MQKQSLQNKIFELVIGVEQISSYDIEKNIQGVTSVQVSKAISALRKQNKIEVVGRTSTVNYAGRTSPVLSAVDGAVFIKTIVTESNKKEVPVRITSGGVVRFKDRKVALLTRLLGKVCGVDRDLLCGCIKDIGGE